MPKTIRDAGTVVITGTTSGIGRSVPFLDDDIDAQVGMVTVHVEATMRLTHAVAPRLIERGAGDIIDVSSLASLFPLPRGAIYASTKAWMEPDEVVAASLKALERREKTVCVPGVANRIVLRIARIVPRRILRGAVRRKRFL